MIAIRADFAVLKRTKWYEYAIRFALGGLITTVAGVVGGAYGPSVGGLFLAFPAIFPAAATLVAKHEREKKARSGLKGKRRGTDAAAVESSGAVMGSAGLSAFAFTAWLLLPSHNPVFVLALATLAWMAISALLWVRRKYGRL